MGRKKFKSLRNNGVRALADGIHMSNDTWKTGLNNNDIIIGPTGSGKTRGYVKPNLLNASESLVITDTKGSLAEEMGPALEKKGYRILKLDIANPQNSIGYNPFDYIERDEVTGECNQKDIAMMAEILYGGAKTSNDPYWDEAAKGLLRSMVSATFELNKNEKNHVVTMHDLIKLQGMLSTEAPGVRMSEYELHMKSLSAENPRSYAATQYFSVINRNSEKTCASVYMILGCQLSQLQAKEIEDVMSKEDKIDILDLAKRKTAIFLTISDMDRSQDKLANLFYAQALQTLCRYADTECEDYCLPVPVRLILDDFATNACIPDFDKRISVIRSRGIAVSLILQSVSQLESMYTHSQAMTIINGCDTLLYLGGQDLETARFIGEKVDRRDYDILNMPLDNSWLIIRGQLPRLVRRIDLDKYPGYKSAKKLAEAKRSESAKNAAKKKKQHEDGLEELWEEICDDLDNEKKGA